MYVRSKCFLLNVNTARVYIRACLPSSPPYLFMPHPIYALVRSRPFYRSHVNILQFTVRTRVRAQLSRTSFAEATCVSIMSCYILFLLYLLYYYYYIYYTILYYIKSTYCSLLTFKWSSDNFSWKNEAPLYDKTHFVLDKNKIENLMYECEFI